MSASSPVRRAFADLVRKADPDLDLARAALLIAQAEYPHLDLDAYLGRLDALAAGVATRLAQAGTPWGSADPPTVIAALNAVLFADLGFHGNSSDYYDPRNSFLNEVLDRRTGIPITISLVYMEVAARLGLRLFGIGMPGRFIVQYPGQDGGGPHPHSGELFIDPYAGGALLTRADCVDHFRNLYGPDFTFAPEHLTPLTRHQILARLLGNLKAIYLRAHDYARAVIIVDRLVLVQPAAIWELKDRGILYYRLGGFVAALRDLQRYLKHDPDAEDAALIAYYVQQCQYLLQSRN